MTHSMIQGTVERVFDREISRDVIEYAESGQFPADLWQTTVDTGLQKILCREEHGGIEASWSDALPLFFEIGYRQVPLPLAGTAVGQFFASKNGINIPESDVMSLIAGPQAKSIQITPCDCPLINGAAHAVKWGRHAQWFLIETPAGSCLVEATDPGITIEEGTDPSGMPSDRVTFGSVKASHWLTHRIEGLTNPVQVAQAATLSAMITGALEYALNLSVQYAKDRVQFGKPISKHQAIQHQLAEMSGEVASSYTATSAAMKDLPSLQHTVARSALFSAAVAKITASEAVSKGTSVAHQVHGAIGFTYEYPLNFATRRLWAWRIEGGTASDWALVLGQAFVRAGSDRFWENLTARTLPETNCKEGHISES